MTLVPLLVLRQRMSALASPLKSPTPAIFQSCPPTPVTTWPVVEFPERQIVLYPVTVLRHRMSALPSPSKSAIPATIHTAPDTVVTDCVLVESAPSQITLAPLEGLRHSMSRTEARRVGKEGVRKCQLQWLPEQEI